MGPKPGVQKAFLDSENGFSWFWALQRAERSQTYSICMLNFYARGTFDFLALRLGTHVQCAVERWLTGHRAHECSNRSWKGRNQGGTSGIWGGNEKVLLCLLSRRIL